jgi:uncharacterized protein (DUF433 family)
MFSASVRIAVPTIVSRRKLGATLQTRLNAYPLVARNE